MAIEAGAQDYPLYEKKSVATTFYISKNVSSHSFRV